MRLIFAGLVSALALSACTPGSAAAPATPEVSSDLEVTLTPVIEA